MKPTFLFYIKAIFRIPLNLGAAFLGGLLWLSRWKAQTLSLNLTALGLSPSTLGSAFRIRWYFHLAQVFLRFLFGAPLASPISVRPRDQIKLAALRNQSSLFLTGHVHDWEALASWMSTQGIPLLGAARPLRSPWADRLLHRLRLRRGVPVLTSGILPGALRHLRQGGCFGILWDQYSSLRRHASPFFGIPAAMDPLPEILVRRLTPQVWVGFLLPSGTFRLLLLHPPGTPLPDPSRLSRRYHRILEIVIRAFPTAWVGLCHGRFKDSLSYGSRRDVSRETMSSNSWNSNLELPHSSFQTQAVREQTSH